MKTRLTLAGEFYLVSRDRRGRRLGDLYFPNGVTDEGVNHFADASFRAGVRYATWYVGLIDALGFSGLSDADTHAGHPGWAEFTGVTAGNRGAWVPAAANAGLVGAAAPTVLGITTSGQVRGAFLASRQPTGLASGSVLYATGAAAAGLTVAAGGTVTISYAVRHAPRS